MVYRIIGPPGTGKTRFISNQVEKWVGQGLYRPDDFILSSHSRTAAAVLQGRVAVPEDHVATLHALGYRALGKPPIAETAPLVDEWNSSALSHWRIGPVKSDINEGHLETSTTDSIFEDYVLWRNLGSPVPHVLGQKVEAFAREWAAFKHEHGAVDFADMIDLPVQERLPCPSSPRVLIMDEAQDAVPSQWRLMRYWAESCERFVVAGDPAQTIYSWAGARPDELMAAEEADFHKTLSYSYRLPAAVHKFAEHWLKQHSINLTKGREYKPRDAEGSVRRMQVSLYEDLMGNLIKDIAANLEHPERTVMVLASCAYMLTWFTARLKREGIPFHNPYRRQAKAWNPLGSAPEGNTGTIERLLAFLRPDRDTWGKAQRPWNLSDARLWLAALRSNVFTGPKKKLLEELKDDAMLTDQILTALTPENRDSAATLQPWWLAGNATNRYEPLMRYGAAIHGHSGGAALRDRPRLTVGTIHSVKGGEADVVYVSPSLSYQGHQQQFFRSGHDALIRLFYVAFTRAREELVLLDPASQLCVRW